MNDEVFLVEAIKPNGKSMLTIPLSLIGEPMLQSPLALREKDFHLLVEFLKANPQSRPDGITMRIVRFTRAEVLQEVEIPHPDHITTAA